jgi:hypothetical protein
MSHDTGVPFKTDSKIQRYRGHINIVMLCGGRHRYEQQQTISIKTLSARESTLLATRRASAQLATAAA